MSDVRSPCPTCGYDLSGAIATWGDSCPLRGTCNECGADVDWAEVLGAARGTRQWHVESRSPGRTYLGRSWSTARRALNPSRFWPAMLDARRLRAWRLLLWLPAMLLPLYLLKSALGNAARLITHVAEQGNIWTYLAWASDDWTMPFALVYYSTPRGGGLVANWTAWVMFAWPAGLWGLIIATAVAPAIMWCWPSTAAARGQERWVARASIFGAGWIVFFGLLGVVDGLARLVRTASDSLIGLAPSGADERWLVPILFDVPEWWMWLPIAWWAWWWWCATASSDLRERRAAWLVLMGVWLLAALMWYVAVTLALESGGIPRDWVFGEF
ncbi:MAG: hypothetical protein ACKVW3_00280 [Phycisphaerales bacterium]